MKEQSEKQIERNKKLAESGKVHRITPENAREYQKRGAEARSRNVERRKSMQEIAKWLGNLAVNKQEILDPEAIVDFKSCKDIHLTVNEAIMMSMMMKAMNGDTASAQFIRDTAGEKPKDEIEVHGMTMDEYAQKHKPKF